jgi:TRAP-type mannitol/chloroaromatic compound transport system permease small subunit
MRKVLRIIDTVNNGVGSAVRWLCPALVLLIALEVTRRFVFNAPSMWAFETAMMIGATIYAFGWAYVHRHRAHVRVDVFYAHLPRRLQALVDVLGNLFIFFPFIIMFTIAAIDKAQYAWAVNEKMEETVWYPPFAPLRTLVAIALILLLFQGAANFIRDFHFLIRNKPYD